MLILPALSQEMNNLFLTSVLRADLSNIAAQRALLPAQLVRLLVRVSKAAVFAGTAILSDSGTVCKTFVRPMLNNQDLPCSKESDQVRISAPQT